VKAVIGIADAVHPDLDPALLTETTTVTENLFVMKMTKTVIEIVTATANPPEAMMMTMTSPVALLLLLLIDWQVGHN
jgi:hypothetical protein